MAGNDYGIPELDAGMANVARVYDYLLGGKDNFAIDRAAAERLLDAVPEAAAAARENRAFLGRAVRFLAGECGVWQFIDVGTGLPTRGSVHEVAQKCVPDARVLYVDYDPVVVAHARALLANDATVVAIHRDLRDPDRILGHPELRSLIDLDQPVAVLLVAVLHFVENADAPHAVVDRFKAAMAPGSYLVISHVTGDGVPAEITDAVRDLYADASAPSVPRGRAEVARFFDGLEMVPPGLVDVSAWRPDAGDSWPARVIFYAGVGCKR